MAADTPTLALAHARRAAGSLVVLALLWGAALGWFAGAGGRSLATVFTIAGLSVVGGWSYWRMVRRALHDAVAAGAAPVKADVAALEAGVAAHEARVRPAARTPDVVTISDGEQPGR